MAELYCPNKHEISGRGLECYGPDNRLHSMRFCEICDDYFLDEKCLFECKICKMPRKRDHMNGNNCLKCILKEIEDLDD